jgi:hypothetical protein
MRACPRVLPSELQGLRPAASRCVLSVRGRQPCRRSGQGLGLLPSCSRAASPHARTLQQATNLAPCFPELLRASTRPRPGARPVRRSFLAIPRRVLHPPRHAPGAPSARQSLRPNALFLQPSPWPGARAQPHAPRSRGPPRIPDRGTRSAQHSAASWSSSSHPASTTRWLPRSGARVLLQSVDQEFGAPAGVPPRRLTKDSVSRAHPRFALQARVRHAHLPLVPEVLRARLRALIACLPGHGRACTPTPRLHSSPAAHKPTLLCACASSCPRYPPRQQRRPEPPGSSSALCSSLAAGLALHVHALRWWGLALRVPLRLMPTPPGTRWLRSVPPGSSPSTRGSSLSSPF